MRFPCSFIESSRNLILVVEVVIPLLVFALFAALRKVIVIFSSSFLFTLNVLLLGSWLCKLFICRYLGYYWLTIDRKSVWLFVGFGILIRVEVFALLSITSSFSSVTRVYAYFVGVNQKQWVNPIPLGLNFILFYFFPCICL